MLQAIALDAFGTLCRINNTRNPYAQLFQLLKTDKAQFRRLALTQSLQLPDLALALSGTQPRSELIKQLPFLMQDLAVELQSIAAFPEAIDTLRQLKARGFRLAVVSNLAEPYGAPVAKIFDGLVDVFVFSFAVGAIKPEPIIFQSLCDSLQLAPQQILMVGDNRINDYEGAASFGMPALHLDRKGGEPSTVTTICDLKGIFDHL